MGIRRVAGQVTSFVKQLPLAGPLARSVWKAFRPSTAFSGSKDYWERRYRQGGNSGSGSYSRLAHFKAEVLNEFVVTHNVRSVIEYGTGDGAQLQLATYASYVGFDVSETALEKCRQMFSGDGTKRFQRMDEYSDEKADLTLSLDVIYHLVEDNVFDAYMRRLFGSAQRFVIAYASNDHRLNLAGQPPHMRHRKFTDWVDANVPEWVLSRHLPNRYPFDPADASNTSCADFFFYERRG